MQGAQLLLLLPRYLFLIFDAILNQFTQIWILHGCSNSFLIIYLLVNYNIYRVYFKLIRLINYNKIITFFLRLMCAFFDIDIQFDVMG